MADLLETRRKAIARRSEIGIAPDALATAAEILALCEEATDYDVCVLPHGDPLLAGSLAVLDVACQSIYQDESRSVTDRRYDAAHEYAHVWLHGGSCHCAEDDLAVARIGETVLDTLRPTSATPVADDASGKVTGYSPRQRREQEANVFASELLLPAPLARRLFLESRLTATAIAEALGIPASVVEAQLVESVLLPDIPEPVKPSQTKVPDPSQIAAAHADRGPLLVGAGPGTGKTSTLVARCRHLTRDLCVPPERILCLTYSRKAAAEMHERLWNAGIGTEEAGPWVGTIHSFCVDVLRRFGEHVGLPSDFRMLDGLDAFTLLENNLKEIGLVELDNLYDPTIHLRGILRQISRAHDELCSVERYAELAESMRSAADQSGDSRLLRDAARAKEVARCYAVYERLKREAEVVDYGDLLHLAVEVLRTVPGARARLRAEFPHVLADEYQDVNRACGELLKLLGGDDAHGIWVVGDWRQSIYRFRGASPANMGAFRRDYKNGRQLELGLNYRSAPAIVSLVDALGHAMGRLRSPACEEDDGGTSLAQDCKSGGTTPVWTAHRQELPNAPLPAVTFATATDDSTQAEGIARTIRHLRGNGHEWRDQAILCRTHGQADALVRSLSERGIPTLYLGDLLERPEIKDLQCLLSLFVDPHGAGLLRLGTLPEYSIPKPDIRIALRHCRESELWPSQAFRSPDLHERLSEDGRRGITRLAAHLKALEPLQRDPVGLLRHYLFGISDYLRNIFVAVAGSAEIADRESVTSLQRRVAIYQFLTVAASFNLRIVAASDDTTATFNRVRPFIDYLRRTAAVGESVGTQLPAAVDAIDAVKIMTAHAAKGLQFKAVFVPNLNADQFPSRGRHDGIPEPPGLAATSGSPGDDVTLVGGVDDDICLFFVALSRAEDHLIVSRPAQKSDGSLRKASPLLAYVQPWRDANGVTDTEWTAESVLNIGGDRLADAPEVDDGNSKSPPSISDNADFRPDDEGPEPSDLSSPKQLPIYSERALQLYMECPRQYYYQNIVRLGGSPIRGAYPKFHACVHEALRWLDGKRTAGENVGQEELFAKLDELWQERGPVGHLHEESYLRTARHLLATALGSDVVGETILEDRTLIATLLNARVRVEPDIVADAADGALVIARRRTGKRGEADHTDPWVALVRQAAAETHPGRKVRLEYRYLQDGTVNPFPEPPTAHKMKLEANRVEKYDNAAAGIIARDFPPDPTSDDRCKTCPFWNVCPG